MSSEIGTLGILEVGDVCAKLREASLELSTQLGGWVTSTDNPKHQRLFATASHQHAWHADLWDQRIPALGSAVLNVRTTTQRTKSDGVAQDLRHVHYSSHLAELSTELSNLACQVDRRLDPSTARTINLVLADIETLRAQF